MNLAIVLKVVCVYIKYGNSKASNIKAHMMTEYVKRQVLRNKVYVDFIHKYIMDKIINIFVLLSKKYGRQANDRSGAER